jgi:hypothetical protein
MTSSIGRRTPTTPSRVPAGPSGPKKSETPAGPGPAKNETPTKPTGWGPKPSTPGPKGVDNGTPTQGPGGNKGVPNGPNPQQGPKGTDNGGGWGR